MAQIGPAAENLAFAVRRTVIAAYPIDISHRFAYKHHMNAPSEIGRKAALFRSNRSQAVRIPKDMEFPEGVKNVVIRKVGEARVLTPKDVLWLDYFAQPGFEGFPERAPQGEYEERESF